MRRLIDADALIDYFREAQDDNKTVMIKIKDLVFMVNNQPTVTERTAKELNPFQDELPYCSECKKEITGDGYNYCPNCGARFTEDNHE